MPEPKTILLIATADPQLQRLLSILLDQPEWRLVLCATGAEAVRQNLTLRPHLVVLDLALPEGEGKATISALREWSQVPLLTICDQARDDVIVESLDLGANDCIARPFSPDVFMARVRAALRSAAVSDAGEPEICNGPLRIDLLSHQVFLNGLLVGFTPKEYALLRFLAVHRGRLLTHKEILKEVWGPAHCDDTQYLRVFVRQLRVKIESQTRFPNFISTEPGVGYRMEKIESENMDDLFSTARLYEEDRKGA